MQNSKATHRLNHLLQHLAQEKQQQVSFLQHEATNAVAKGAATAEYLVQLDDYLTVEEQAIRYKMRNFVESFAKPVLVKYIEAGQFPDELLPVLLKQVGPAGGIMKGYGCPGWSHMAYCAALMEMARGDGSMGTFFMVHIGVGMMSIYLCGSEEQKKKYLPRLANYETTAAFALTEPEKGSDATQVDTYAVRHKDGSNWVLNGTKRWIGNASKHGAVIVIWAMNSQTKQLEGFIVENTHPGVKIEVLQHKIAMRCVQNCVITLTDCVIPESQRLAHAKDFQSGAGKVLFVSRLYASWLPIGISIGAYEACLKYCKERKQFKKPLASFQLVQQKLVTIASNIQAMLGMSIRATQLLQQDKMTHGMASMAKSFNSKMGRECVALARELVGGNGIIRDYGVATAFVDMEAVYTYEGSFEINTLVVGRELTGFNAIK